MGRFMFNVMGSFAQLEREMIQERTKAGLLAVRERGRVGGRRVVLTPELLEEAQQLMADKAAGGGGLSAADTAKRLKVSKAASTRPSPKCRRPRLMTSNPDDQTNLAGFKPPEVSKRCCLMADLCYGH
jgi:DNA invertase Pin-like site-specific DNA recombinase